MTARPDADRCPGLLRAFSAADGLLVRLRVPGGRVPLTQLRALVDLAAEHGAPIVQLTSRANLQVRALPDPLPDAFVAGVTAAGLLPHPTHERVRNILASPWSDRAGEVAALVVALDDALCADPELARLPGRFLFVVDDGSGDVLDAAPVDLSYQLGESGQGRLVVGGLACPLPIAEAVPALIQRARQFVAEREAMTRPVWNVRELDADSAVLADLEPVDRPGVAGAPPVGRRGGDLVAAVPLGLLTVGQVAALEAVVDEVVVTPWRSLVLPGGVDTALLDDAGLSLRGDDGWDRLTACIGAPFCRRTDVNTGALAHQLVASPALGTKPVHLSGCERRCGAPTRDHVDLMAPASLAAALQSLENDR